MGQGAGGRRLAAVREVVLRALRPEDFPALAVAEEAVDDPLLFFGFHPANRLQRRYDRDGLICDDDGRLAVTAPDGRLLGDVGWRAVQQGPTAACRAINVGITLLPEHRGQGYGSAAQAALAAYLFATTTVERLEAGTDVANLAEQRALQRAGFQREGMLRHAQFRAGAWRDVVLFSRLRADPYPT